MSEPLPRSYAPSEPCAPHPATLLGDTVICFSSARWDLAFQRTQHLMARFAKTRRVIYWQAASVGGLAEHPYLDLQPCRHTGVTVAAPHLPLGLAPDAAEAALRQLLEDLFAAEAIAKPLLWYCDPDMLSFAPRQEAAAIVYDCARLADGQAALLELADLVFTAGYGLYEVLRRAHDNVHPFPSGVEVASLAQARNLDHDPGPHDQAALARPRLGFHGVVDERVDLDLLARLAAARPDWSFVMIGPVIRISPADLPSCPNIRWLGGKAYGDLPRYMAGWDIAIAPLVMDDEARLFCPEETAQYLAAGLPVVTTPIPETLLHYGALDAVQTAHTWGAFLGACEGGLKLAARGTAWRQDADKVLAGMDWDEVFARMSALVDLALMARRAAISPLSAPAIRAAPAKPYDYLVVGAGFAGAVMAERLAAGSNKRVLIIDKRPHLGGNAHDYEDAAGIRVNAYGPHVFHTRSQEVFTYLSRFTRWRPYEHRVMSCVRGILVPQPVNRATLNTLYGLNLHTDIEAEAWLKGRAAPIDKARTARDLGVALMGGDLYDSLFAGFIRKQRGLDPSELDKAAAPQTAPRTSADDRAHLDSFQAMPAEGYARLFETLLDHRNIDILLGADFEEVRREAVYDRLVFTGRIDAFFDYRLGELPYRSIAFRHETLDQPWFQPVATVDHPDAGTPYTRVTEFKHITGQSNARTSLVYEYPSETGEPFHAAPRPEDQAAFRRYDALARQTPEVQFVGRLAAYRDMTMDQTVGQALACYRRIAERDGRAAVLAGDEPRSRTRDGPRV